MHQFEMQDSKSSQKATVYDNWLYKLINIVVYCMIYAPWWLVANGLRFNSHSSIEVPLGLMFQDEKMWKDWSHPTCTITL